jgi:effector-binding domain-containing protein
VTAPRVTVQMASPRDIAAVRARLVLRRVPAVFREYLDQVYAAARAGVVAVDGQNIFVYRGGRAPDDEVDVECGVGVHGPFTASGAVVHATLPTGEAATATHWGDYSRLGETHAAVVAWCRDHGRTITGTRWEVYGHWTDDPASVRTDVFYQLTPSA